jgi:hypothetical protein
MLALLFDLYAVRISITYVAAPNFTVGPEDRGITYIRIIHNTRDIRAVKNVRAESISAKLLLFYVVVTEIMFLDVLYGKYKSVEIPFLKGPNQYECNI